MLPQRALPCVRARARWAGVCLGALAGIGLSGSPRAAAPAEPPKRAMVEPGSAEQSFDCVIEPYQVIKLSSAVLGVIDKLNVDRGDRVSKGQIVAQLESSVEMANLTLAQAKAKDEYSAGSIRARLEFLNSKRARAELLAAKGVAPIALKEEAASDAEVAAQQLKEAELTLHVAQLEEKHAQALVQQKLVRSPINGVVVEIMLHPGEYRNEQSPIMTLAQIDPLRVEVFVPARLYKKIKKTSSAIVYPEEPMSGSRNAKISVIDPVVDASSGTFGVRLSIPNPKHEFVAGLKCKVQFGD